MQFVSRFEKSLTSVASVKRMRSHPSYASFKAKWGLSIYFQIRFQEISGRLEASLLSPFELNPKQKEEEEVVSKDTVTWEVKPSIDGAPYGECVALFESLITTYDNNNNNKNNGNSSNNNNNDSNNENKNITAATTTIYNIGN